MLDLNTQEAPKKTEKAEEQKQTIQVQDQTKPKKVPKGLIAFMNEP